MWWDKATGMRIYYENSGEVGAIFTAAYTYTVVYKLVDSSINNVSYIPETFTPILLLLMLGASTASIVLYRRRKIFI
jgi:hypothetical protein